VRFNVLSAVTYRIETLPNGPNANLKLELYSLIRMPG
jgi:hypothetical protein